MVKSSEVSEALHGIQETVEAYENHGYDTQIVWMMIDDKYKDGSIGVRFEFRKELKK